MTVEAVKEAYEKEGSMRKAATALGMSSSTVDRWLKKGKS
jgi:transposase-like protein